MSDANQDAQSSSELKKRGDALFKKAKFASARGKYTQALVLDPNNAVLHADRARCSIKRELYLEAYVDSHKATQIDPSYAKGWARLATASSKMNLAEEAVSYWKSALDALPKDNLKSAERAQKEEYEKNLADAEQELQDNPLQPIINPPIAHQEPWIRATTVPADTLSSPSSASVIRGAHEEWMLMMASITGEGSETDVLLHFTNAILRDERIFHLDSPELLPSLYRSAIAECNAKGAWTKEVAEGIISSSEKILATSGWDEVRQRLETTVRWIIMEGFLSGSIRKSYQVSVEYLNQALLILDWGRRVHKDVPEAEKGVIFSDIFVCGVKSMHIQRFAQAFIKVPPVSSGSALETLAQLAEGIIRDVLGFDEPGNDLKNNPGLLMSQYLYPRAEALAMKGLYHYYKGRLTNYENLDERCDNFVSGARLYIQAANIVPRDEENYTMYLDAALHSLWRVPSPISETLPIVDRIQEATPQMKRIWEYSEMGLSGGHDILDFDVRFAAPTRKALADGTLTLETRAVPEELGYAFNPRYIINR